MEESTAKKKVVITKPTWEMSSQEKIDFIGRYGLDMWEKKLNGEVPDPKDKEAFQEWRRRVDEGKKRNS